MTGTEVAAIIAAVAFAVLVVVLVIFLLQLNKNITKSMEKVNGILDEADKTVTVLTQDVDILLKQSEDLLVIGNDLLSDVTQKVETIDPLFHAVADLSESVSELNSSSKTILSKVGEASKTAATATVVGKAAQTASHLFKKNK
ncbi:MULTISPECIES: DUF948 domain-containing protein [Enterococcaceae]|uniref:General stress protein n=1 Tax=Vagococcus luciliae TaxID=2920380 RepID=A0ABY5NZW3_9ENTE|nr:MULTISPECIES: DUF948 domain-containing protein [Enterococcaceae]MCI0129962.1 DUF948 domain-containing protein [Vagococcus sp. CY53-2]RGI30831.1 DUF948 domain-containing protein [Melissococcus sp. OM08-11BH]UNM90507.1 DUF948 domain-containing protein [Vagococcus sp. CY52-2]UUV99210.1 hypothetical protein G314FT_13700 [Vagococcus luciliae]